MPVELEAKIPVESHDAVRNQLRTAGAEYVGKVLETNHLLDHTDCSLRDSGCGLRVRSIQILDGEGPGATMTFKGPKQAGAFKQREEHETQIENADAALAILRGLGHTRELVFEKRRETWRLGDCTIELDEVPVLGRFVEIEGPSAASIQHIIDALHLDGSRNISDSYVAMLAAQAPDVPNPEFRF
ncbi:MAG: class IV adenylate cyclase [Phycisphaerales bacterium]|nr:class IV adenylate cyclase [Phycisphaerales bacterium]MCB9855651.1 class IV adenylate cyclase [Phycisphaerales bacterium]MCB9862547.1 class IV adenylate cyclase [Phycisphaerales bacterium]